MSEQEVPQEKKEELKLVVPDFEMKDDFGEAGGIAFTTVVKTKKLEDGTVERLEINLTGRGHTAHEALNNLFNGIELASQHGYTAWKRQEKMTALPAAKTNAATASGGVAPLPGAAAKPAAAPAQPAPATGGGTFRATKMTITPRADGKLDMEFFAEGHKFADLKAIKTVDAAITTLASVAPFTANDLAQAASYAIEANVRWVNSENLNKAGNPYKNLVDVTPA